MTSHFTRIGVVVVAAASLMNLGLTITSDAQTGYADLQAAMQRIEARQLEVCRP